MGVILDSSVVIAAERRGDTVEKLIERVVSRVGDQNAALSSVGLTELLHAVYRAPTLDLRSRRAAFIEELLRDMTVYPYTIDTARVAAKIDSEQRVKGMTIPFPDLLIGATALALDFSILTINVRHFRHIPGLTVVQY